MSDDESCLRVDLDKINCEILDQSVPILALMYDSIKKKYANSEIKNLEESLNKDLKHYIDFHNKLNTCPNHSAGCPYISISPKPKKENNPVVERYFYSTFGRPCKISRPNLEYLNRKGKLLLSVTEDRVDFSIIPVCSKNGKLQLSAGKSGLLIGANNPQMEFSSNSIGRKILFNADSLDVKTQSDTGRIRITWKSGTTKNWIEVDPEKSNFHSSNFMDVNQINSGNCKVAKKPMDPGRCKKNRRKLKSRNLIRNDNEYKCLEYYPVFETSSPSEELRG